MTFPELRGPSSSLPAPTLPQSPPQSETLYAVPSLCPLTLPAPWPLLSVKSGSHLHQEDTIAAAAFSETQICAKPLT